MLFIQAGAVVAVAAPLCCAATVRRAAGSGAAPRRQYWAVTCCRRALTIRGPSEQAANVKGARAIAAVARELERKRNGEDDGQ
eukprot:1177113-Prorocentrum_minimum.AAC.2